MGKYILCSLAALFIVMGSTLAFPAEAKTEIDYRLPKNVIPLEYNLKLKPLLGAVDNPTFFTGEIDIKVLVKEETDTIILHYNDLQINTVTMEDADGETITVADSYDSVTHFYTIMNMETQPFLANNEYTIKILYTGYHRDDMYGFYRSYYKAEDGTTRWLATTQFQPTHARRAFPCFDEPALKANFTISVQKTGGRTVISNMPLKSEEGLWSNFEETPKMSSYLIAFIVSDFVSHGDEKYKIWAREQAIDQADYSFKIAEETIKAMETFLQGSEYTLPKMDEAAIPDFSAGAMENWGLCTYRERLILYDKSAANADHKQRIATVVAHEFAHQWFGDLISPEWWNFLWLNEGFATYFESFATAEVETTWRLQEQFVVRDLQSSMIFDALESSHPMTQDVSSPASIRSIFDTISYEKAGSVIRMMEHFVTTDVFKKGLKRYIDERNHDYANEDHLYKAIDDEFKASNPTHYEDVLEVMHTWSLQPGFPLLTVTSIEGNQLSLTQARFAMRKIPTPKADGVWTIPITYTVQGQDFTDTSTKAWMKEASLNITKPSDSGNWHIFNVQETGYYRVNYDEENWKLLINYLQSPEYDKIHVVNRAQLLDDSLNLARAGIIPYGTALDLTRYLSQETDYIPWYSALTGLSYLKLRLTGTQLEAQFKNYIMTLIEDVYNNLGFEDSDEDGHVTKLHRSLILQWACELDHDHCVANAHEKFNLANSKDTSNVAIPADLQSVIYCTVIRHGSETEWNHLWDKYLDSNFATEQTLIISALGCTPDRNLIEKYLEKSITLDGGIRSQDTATVFSSVYVNPAGVELALGFLNDRFEDILGYFGGEGYGVTNIISGLASRISTTEQLEKFKNFIDSKDLGAAQSAAVRALESAQENLAWTEHYQAAIGEWLGAGSTVEPNETTAAAGILLISPLIKLVFIIKAILTFI